MEATDLEPNPEEKSEAVQRENPKEHAAVKPVAGLRKLYRGRHKPKDGSRRKLHVAVARGGTTRRAKVVRRKKNVVRENQTRDKAVRGALKKTDVRMEASAETGTQKEDKEPRPETAAMKQEGIYKYLQENHRTGDREANCRLRQKEEGSTPPKREKNLLTMLA
jgi:hypothetical protein